MTTSVIILLCVLAGLVIGFTPYILDLRRRNENLQDNMSEVVHAAAKLRAEHTILQQHVAQAICQETAGANATVRRMVRILRGTEDS